MNTPIAFDLGDLRRVTPIDLGFGVGRGKPVDRHYIESFLRQHATDADDVPGDSFDCFICTQTLTYIYDVKGALATIQRILKPGGVLLVTVPGISQMSPYDRDRWGEYWRFTAQSLGRLLGDAFGNQNVTVESYGNVLASTAFLQGLCAGDLSRNELEHRDQRYQMLIAGRAVKAP
ncbi:MAG: class I SAM-dependent methyltransferase [Pseudomonadota bacterium]|nr:class I SAM-dependent methyltransferase [Pseudomonadota bacterium]